MLPTSLILLFVITVCIFPGLSCLIINLNIGNNLSCDINVEDIRQANFSCQEDDHSDKAFNLTHTWYVENNRKCVASIQTVKTIAGHNCYRRIPRSIIHSVQTPHKHGQSINKKPLNSSDVFQ